MHAQFMQWPRNDSYFVFNASVNRKSHIRVNHKSSNHMLMYQSLFTELKSRNHKTASLSEGEACKYCSLLQVKERTLIAMRSQQPGIFSSASSVPPPRGPSDDMVRSRWLFASVALVWSTPKISMSAIPYIGEAKQQIVINKTHSLFTLPIQFSFCAFFPFFFLSFFFFFFSSFAVRCYEYR